MREKKKELGSNIIDNEVFIDLKTGIGMSVKDALKIAEGQGKEVELTIKIKVDTEHKVDNDKMLKWVEPNVDYKVTRTIKESKFDFKGEIKKAAIKIVNGEVFIESMEKDEPIQMSFFEYIEVDGDMLE